MAARPRSTNILRASRGNDHATFHFQGGKSDHATLTNSKGEHVSMSRGHAHARLQRLMRAGFKISRVGKAGGGRSGGGGGGSSGS